MKDHRSRRWALVAVVILWLALIGGFAWLNVEQVRQFHLEEELKTARSYFDIIVTIRSWNAQHGGVYVPVTADIQPNPYLDVPDRDIVTTDGITLTKINPAYMTRLVAEIARRNNNVNFHITSLNPIRPANAAEPWERDALLLFEDGKQTEYYRWDTADQMFYYMAPLITEASCLQCHAKQGYQLGDVRGGIGIWFSAQPPQVLPLAASYALIGGMGVLLISVFGWQLASAFGKLEQLAEIDGLTQVGNRQLFDTNYHREFLRTRRARSPLSVIMGDIDFFKPYNDLYGHQAGDACLKQVAQALKDVVKRPGDLVARYGGEEFVVIMPDTPLEGCRTVAELLRARVEALTIPHAASAISGQVTMSFGCSTYEGDEILREAFLEMVDRALYQAKQAGRNMVVAIACSADAGMLETRRARSRLSVGHKDPPDPA